jgi:2-desacetyl-2-hydroxyethyl bacteriochlorophyllide A dehydrogenase
MSAAAELPATMKAIVCREPGHLALEERPVPKSGPGEVLVRIRRVGVCGTDMHIYQGKHPFLAYPRVMGHELGGEIAWAPAGSSFGPGDPVYVVPYLSCGTCVACRKGKTNCCANIQVLGVHCDGGMTEYLALPEGNVVKAEGLSFDELAMVEFLAIGAHAVRRAAPGKGDRVLVVGAGPIGMGVMIFAGLTGATVTALDMRADRLAFCRDKLGVAHTVAIGPDDVAALSALTDGEFFDVVFDATGNLQAMERGLDFVAQGGSYVLVSIVRDRISFSDPEFHKRETTLFGSRNATREDFDTVMRAFRAGKVPSAALATHSAPLADLPAVLDGWIRPDAGVVKAILSV